MEPWSNKFSWTWKPTSLQNNWKVYLRCIGWLCYLGDVLEDEDDIKWI